MKNPNRLLVALSVIFPVIASKAVLASEAETPQFEADSHHFAEMLNHSMIRYRAAIRTVCGKTSAIFEARYHAEANQVDLTDFDGCSVTVDLGDLDKMPPNGED